MVKKKPAITQELLIKRFVYDSIVGDLRWRCGVRINHIAGSLDKKGYRQIKIDGFNFKAHRLVFCYHYGFMPENMIDHIDRDPGNNHIENLREVSRSCNMFNTKDFCNNRSGVRGVFWKVRDNRWIAVIGNNGKRLHLGSFSNFEDAVIARADAENLSGVYECMITSARKYLDERSL